MNAPASLVTVLTPAPLMTSPLLNAAKLSMKFCEFPLIET